jgi:hypothetical protein
MLESYTDSTSNIPYNDVEHVLHELIRKQSTRTGQQSSEGHNSSSTQRTIAYEHSMERSRNILQHLP